MTILFYFIAYLLDNPNNLVIVSRCICCHVVYIMSCGWYASCHVVCNLSHYTQPVTQQNANPEILNMFHVVVKSCAFNVCTLAEHFSKIFKVKSEDCGIKHYIVKPLISTQWYVWRWYDYVMHGATSTCIAHSYCNISTYSSQPPPPFPLILPITFTNANKEKISLWYTVSFIDARSPM